MREKVEQYSQLHLLYYKSMKLKKEKKYRHLLLKEVEKAILWKRINVEK
jgi:hypothetical protein